MSFFTGVVIYQDIKPQNVLVANVASLDSTEIMMKVCGSYDSCLCMTYLSELNGVHLEIGVLFAASKKPSDPRLMKL